MAEKIALGTVQLGLAYGANNTVGLPSEQEAADIVRLAAGAGVAMLDTAHGYGLSEEQCAMVQRFDPATEAELAAGEHRGGDSIGFFVAKLRKKP